MRLLIIGALEGQLSEATKLAMDGGAKVAHAESIEVALASLRAGRGADLLLADVMADIPGCWPHSRLNASTFQWWHVEPKPTPPPP